jgi:hypothetical protein
VREEHHSFWLRDDVKNPKDVRDVASSVEGSGAAVANPGLELTAYLEAQSGINYDESLEYAVPIEVVHAR